MRGVNDPKRLEKDSAPPKSEADAPHVVHRLGYRISERLRAEGAIEKVTEYLF